MSSELAKNGHVSIKLSVIFEAGIKPSTFSNRLQIEVISLVVRTF